MRSDVNESVLLKSRSGSRRERGLASATPARMLEANAVDAALADETMPMLTERASRRDLASGREGAELAKRLIDGPHSFAHATESGDADGLLRSLAEQLDLLHRQQQEIRILLDQAGRRRVDQVGR